MPKYGGSWKIAHIRAAQRPKFMMREFHSVKKKNIAGKLHTCKPAKLAMFGEVLSYQCSIKFCRYSLFSSSGFNHQCRANTVGLRLAAKILVLRQRDNNLFENIEAVELGGLDVALRKVSTEE